MFFHPSRDDDDDQDEARAYAHDPESIDEADDRDDADRSSQPPDREEQMQRALQVQQRYEGLLMTLPHVVGVGVGYATKDGHPTDEIALIVMVDEKLPEAQLADEVRIPSHINGVRVDVQTLGGFYAH